MLIKHKQAALRSHVTNHKVLVVWDSICHRWKAQSPHTPCGTWALGSSLVWSGQQLALPPDPPVCILRSKRRGQDGRRGNEELRIYLSIHYAAPRSLPGKSGCFSPSSTPVALCLSQTELWALASSLITHWAVGVKNPPFNQGIYLRCKSVHPDVHFGLISSSHPPAMS